MGWVRGGEGVRVVVGGLEGRLEVELGIIVSEKWRSGPKTRKIWNGRPAAAGGGGIGFCGGGRRAHVQVAADEDDLALEVRAGEVADGLLGHRRDRADALALRLLVVGGCARGEG